MMHQRQLSICFRTAAWVTLTLLVVTSLPQCQGQQSGQVEFHIKEQRPSGTNVGSIRDRARLADKVPRSELDNLRFEFLNPSELKRTASLFSINQDNGAVYTTAMIDRESVCQFEKDCSAQFEVTVTSSTMTNFFEIVTVRIVIEDINDNAPRFPNDEVTLFISESVNANSEFRIAGASDKDTDEENSVQKYIMKTEHRDMFELKSEKKLDGTWDLSIVTLQTLDRERMDHYLLHIIAKDNGKPPQSGNVTVHINVTDTNDNSPIFSENVYDISVPERAEVGAVVGQVNASDADKGMNSAVTYQFSPTRSSGMSNLFYIDSHSGEIKVKSPLQYEAGKSFETIVIASDRGNPPRASQAVLILSILDVGNTAPRISITPVPKPEGRVLRISEASAVKTVVAHVRTDDRDTGPNGIVDCRSATQGFNMRRFEGSGFLVETSEPLDRETSEEINVTIICDDRGSPKLSASGSFIIRLIDSNDNAPVFTRKIYEANLTEGNRRGDHVLFVKAHDRDINENAEIHYTISMSTAESSSSFLIDSRTGEITAGEEFDRETLSQVSFMVRAVDRGLPQRTGMASVVVDIKDVNDNSPYFTSSMEFQIAEKLPASSLVDKLLASDRDSGKNAEVHFSIPKEFFNQPDSSIPFVVLPSGIIRTGDILDKDKQSLYKFPVQVTDKGQPYRSSTATVTIRVIDSNDHKPRFTFPTRGNNTIRLKPDTAPGTTIATLEATDDDIGRNARLKYYIVSGNRENAFTIPFPRSGQIMLMKDLTSLEASVFHLNVSVHDQGIPMLQADEVLKIQVDFVNGRGVGSRRGDDDGGGNSTNGLFGDDELKYIIIAGVVGGVTVVISVIIVTVILVIRRPDNNNRSPTPVGVQEQGDGRHFDKQMWQSVPVDDLTPTDTEEKKVGTLKGGMDGGGGGGGGGRGGGGGGGGGDLKKANGGMNSNYNGDLMDPPYGRKHAGPEPFLAQPQLYTFKKVST
ncbi:protocadherin-11 X-linked [Aplysia californica]|uniref:Protocadherin-11 X-linked n=1 Tax=Aplysia californica TaxID=6500 RepID=A0ABM1VRC1_APLCA|nr:protocadherin-11 X-linked [Aplysia californica]